MRNCESFSGGLNRALTIFGAVMILAIAVGITAEVLLRKTLNMTLGGMDEIASYGFAIFTALGFSVAALARANIRIDVLRALFPKFVRIALDLLAQVALIAFAGFLTWRAVLLVSASWSKGTKAITPLATPVAWPQSIWLAALGMFVAILIVMFALSLRALLSGNSLAFAALAAPTGELDELSSDSPIASKDLNADAREA